MDVNSFLGALAAPDKPDTTTSAASVEGDKPPEYSGGAESQSETTEGRSVISDTTPNGAVIEYESQPKRLYRVNGVEVPSVTTVLDVLKADGLVWWGQTKGVQGVIELFDRGALTSGFDWDVDRERLVVNEEPGVVLGGYADEPTVTDLLKHHKLTVNHRLEEASDRGVNVHDALEQWGKTGELPDPDEFPDEERGYVIGLVGFLKDVKPEPVRQEVMVGSVEHGYAGRFDLVAHVPIKCEYTSRCYPKRKDKREELIPQVLLADLKTSKWTYDKHFLQLAAYEMAAVECGYPATDGQAVIHVTADGKYELVFSKATGAQFLAVKQAYDALEELAA